MSDEIDHNKNQLAFLTTRGVVQGNQDQLTFLNAWTQDVVPGNLSSINEESKISESEIINNQIKEEPKSPDSIETARVSKNIEHSANNTLDKLTKYDCIFCFTVFKNEQARKNHYIRAHNVENENLIFCQNGTALVNSPNAHRVKSHPDWFQDKVKNHLMNDTCKLCNVDGMEELFLNEHFRIEHKVKKEKQENARNLIRLDPSDTSVIGDYFKCTKCGKDFAKRCTLNNHLLGHQNSNLTKVCINLNSVKGVTKRRRRRRVAAYDIQKKKVVRKQKKAPASSVMQNDVHNEILQSSNPVDATEDAAREQETKAESYASRPPRGLNLQAAVNQYQKYIEYENNTHMDSIPSSNIGYEKMEFSNQSLLAMKMELSYTEECNKNSEKLSMSGTTTCKQMTRKRKSPDSISSNTGETVKKTRQITSQLEVVSDQTPTSNGSSVTLRRSPSISSTVLANKSYNCELCAVILESKQARNAHYTGKHKIINEKLLFFPNGTGLVESSLEHEIKLNPDYLKTAARKMSSDVCKLCNIKLSKDELKWHYESVHKVFQLNRLKPLICLNNSDIIIVEDPFKCKTCLRTFDVESRLKKHLLTHRVNANEVTCKYCNLVFKRNEHNAHVKRAHPEHFLKMVETMRNVNVNQDVNPLVYDEENIARRGTKCKKKHETACFLCPFKTSSHVTLKKHMRCVHQVTELCNSTSWKQLICQNNVITETPVAVDEQKTQNDSTSLNDDNGPVNTSNKAIMMFLCKACHLATTSYDEAVAHSQDHILDIVNTETTLCEHCNLKFGAEYQTHKQLHTIPKDLSRDSFHFVPFDYKLLGTDKWFDMLEYLTNAKKRIITCDHSVYFSTRCIRFTIPKNMKNTAAPFLLFQCMTCKNYVNPFSIESHVQEQSCSIGSESYPCEVCRAPFYTDEARIQHSNTHKVPDADSKYRSISFNDRSHLPFNELLLKTANKSVPKQSGAPCKKTAMQDQVTDSENDKNKGNVVPLPEKLATVYKCRCDLCFHSLSHLFDHLLVCSSTLNVEKETCKCGLVFDVGHYRLHTKVHCNYTTILVKDIIIKPCEKINIRGMVDEFRKARPEDLLINVTTSKIVNENTDKMECNNNSEKSSNNNNYRVDTETEKSDNQQMIDQQKQYELCPKVVKVESLKTELIQQSSEKTVLPTHTNAGKPAIPQNGQFISDDVKKVISLYNCLRDLMNILNPAVTSQTKTGPTDDTTLNNAKNNKDNISLVGTTTEVEDKHCKKAQNRRANEDNGESNAKESTKTSVKLPEHSIDSEGEFINESQNQITKPYINDSNGEKSAIGARIEIANRLETKKEIVNKDPIGTMSDRECDIPECEEEDLLKEPDYAIGIEIIELLSDDEL